MFKKTYLPFKLSTRQCSAKPQKKLKPKVILNEEISNLIKEDKLKPRKQPGVILRTVVRLPEWLTNAMKRALDEHPRKTIVEDAAGLYRHLNGRHPPPEQELINLKYSEVSKSLYNNSKYMTALDGSDEEMQEKMHHDTVKILKRKVHPWAPIQYDKYRGLMYMVARGSHDYAILYRILLEIKERDPGFKPKTLLDFGSGIGTVSWVASQFWTKSLNEYLCIDASEEISNLAEWFAKLSQPRIKNIFFKQYLPVTNNPTFDIVVSAFTLMELPSRKSRIETILNLWRRADRYLVLVEQGTNAGFKLINEAREFITHLIDVHKKRELYEAFIFSPCPHELKCPRIEDGTNTPCNFEVRFFPMSYNRRDHIFSERYSYIVFKKGSSRGDNEKWPRIVRETIVHSGHAICRMCTSEGKLQEIIFSKSKHDRPLYYCARKSLWGDRLPIEIKNNQAIDQNIDDATGKIAEDKGITNENKQNVDDANGEITEDEKISNEVDEKKIKFRKKFLL
ncbi:methyltransferase-like protein 17, mitochondrial [Microplitis demolitor]|uniref:methyltransferase-like protein 17, mitochondrial n=1 Tax=Microplitis demolitor TaxID=69319 RepID=UPI0006D4D3D0|nr:methyltransferase-like protein 17, mitochondrial [Microplitis demolitor]